MRMENLKNVAGVLSLLAEQRQIRHRVDQFGISIGEFRAENKNSAFPSHFNFSSFTGPFWEDN